MTLGLAAASAGALAVARFGAVAEVRAFAAAAGAVLVAPALGSVVRLWRAWGIGPELVLRFGLGNVLVLLIALGCNAVGQFSVTLVCLLCAIAVFLAVVACAWRLRTVGVSMPGRPSPGALLGAVIAVAGALAAAGYWRSRSPLPYQSTWDGILHLGIVERMLVNRQFALSVKSISPAFGIDAYLPNFHLDLGIASRVSAVPVLDELWAGTFVLTGLAGGGVFALTRRMWPGTAAASGAAALTGLFMVTRRSTNPLFGMLPASEVVAMAPLALLVLCDPDRGRRLRRGVAISATLCTIHALMGALLLGVMVMSELVSFALQSRTALRPAATIVIGTSAAIVAVLFAFPITLRAHMPSWLFNPTSFYASLAPSTTLYARMTLVGRAFAHPLPALLVLVATTVLFAYRGRADPAARLRAVPVIVFVGLLVPTVGLERLEGFLWLAMTVSVGALLWHVELAVRRLPMTPGAAPLLATALVIAIPIASVPWLIGPLAQFRKDQRFDTSEKGLQSSFAPYELSGIPAFAARDGRRRVVVSDPMTQEFAEGFGLFRSAGGIGMSTGLYLDVVRALASPSPGVERARLATLQRRLGSFLLIVSGRSEHWAVPLYEQWRAGRLTNAVLKSSATFRPWDFAALPDQVVGRTKNELLRPIRASGCVTDEDDRGEIVAFVVDCSRPGR